MTWSIAETVSPLTGPAAPSATFPIVADASPLTFTTATAAPVAKAPAATPMAYACTSRVALTATVRPPPAFVIAALSSIWAFCVPVSLTTATWAPTPTKPPPPANPMGVVFSSMLAETVTAPPALMLAYGEMPASVTLLTFRTSTEPPTPTAPPAAAPAIPNTERTSFAMTLT